MSSPVDEATLAQLLPGSWRIAATNFPMWLGGERSKPRVAYGLVSTSPLVLSDEVTYLDPEGADKQILGTDTWRHDEFQWRGKRLLKVIASHWTVSGFSEDGTVVATQFSKSLATPAGIDIVVREGVEYPELRAMIARDHERYGLSPEDFGSLTWLPGATPA